MAEFSVTEHIEAPIETTFAVFTDLDSAPQVVDPIVRVERLTEGPVGMGARWRETRVMFGRETTEEMNITAFDPPRRYVVECESCGAHYRSTFSFHTAGGATDVTLHIEARAVSLMARLMSPLAAMAAKSMKKAIAADLAQYKAAAERGA